MTPQLAFPRRWFAPLALAASTMLLAACGGGGSDSATGSPTASPASYTTGRISGFGSVIVNGVRFNDSKVKIRYSDNVIENPEDGASKLALGMVVEIKAGRIDDSTARGDASEIVVRSEIKGPVEAVNAAAGTLTVLGQLLRVDAATVYEDTSGLAALSVGSLVEVYAVPSTGGALLATRIEAKASLGAYKLRGTVASLDTTVKTFRIGNALISYAGVAAPAGLKDGAFVKVKLATVRVAGAWVASKIRLGEREIEVENHGEAEVDGQVSGFVNLASFKVAGVPVDASGSAVVFAGGTAADVTNGARVEVEGSLFNGVLVATKVKIENGDEQQEREVELHGAITSVDTVARTFVLRGVTVAWNDTTQFRGITAAGIVIGPNGGPKVEVKAYLAAGGASVVADKISAED